MLCGYIDESGTPGVTTKEDDYLAVSLVLINSDQQDRMHIKLENASGKIGAEEIHYSHNTNRARDKIISVIANLDFKYIFIAIKKNETRNHASYENIAKILIDEIKRNCKDINIKMDMNPGLFSKLKAHAKASKLHIQIRQVRSSGNLFIQLTDYVTAITTQYVKGFKLSPKELAVVSKCFSMITR